MLSNIASTAVGVGIGHAIGHGLTGLFGGGSSAPAAVDSAAAPATADSNTRVGACDADAKAFTKCMDDYKGDMTACSWYLDQLKVLSDYMVDVDL
jgi:coiled-coil-helix-coiled-coil-helix domain-containing protein 2